MAWKTPGCRTETRTLGRPARLCTPAGNQRPAILQKCGCGKEMCFFHAACAEESAGRMVIDLNLGSAAGHQDFAVLQDHGCIRKFEPRQLHVADGGELVRSRIEDFSAAHRMPLAVRRTACD